MLFKKAKRETKVIVAQRAFYAVTKELEKEFTHICLQIRPLLDLKSRTNKISQKALRAKRRQKHRILALI